MQKLYTYPGNKNAAKALIAAEYNAVKIDLPAFEMGVTNKTEKYLKLNPFGKARTPYCGARRRRRKSAGLKICPRAQVPTLETPEGGIFESNAIARYIARKADKGLLGSTPIETARFYPERTIEPAAAGATSTRSALCVLEACAVAAAARAGVQRCWRRLTRGTRPRAAGPDRHVDRFQHQRD